jgi:Lon protease-like protein
VGCTARVTDVFHRYRDGRLDILTRGGKRFRITPFQQGPGMPEVDSLSEEDFNAERAFFRGVPAYLDDEAPARRDVPPDGKSDDEILITQALTLRGELMNLIAEDDPDSALPRQQPPAAGNPQLSYHLMDGLPAESDWKQELLELRVERERLVRVVLHLQRLIEYMQEDADNPTPDQVA